MPVKIRGFLTLLCLPSLWAGSQVDLNGPWRFALDPHQTGEQHGWYKSPTPGGDSNWARVTVPHCWPVDPRYPYTGVAWYRRTFPTPAGAGQHVRLVFSAVFYKTKVWLNGEPLGEHEGGYTPFEFDVTGKMKPQGDNLLAVRVDDSWSDQTIPGSRPGSSPQDQVYPWWDFGGIVREVHLAITSPVYIVNQKVAASDQVNATVWVRNTSGNAVGVRVSAAVAGVAGARWEKTATIPPGATTQVELSGRLPQESIHLWDQDHPSLYTLRSSVSTSSQELDSAEANFGVRTIATRGQQLLLNSQPIKMGGANRQSDHPKFGLIDPPEVVDADMKLMKSAGMELSRISHYPVSPELLDWADRNGVLIIEQCPNWQMRPSQMDSPEMRANFRRQLEEMIQRDWNHPSVIGWSVGNEYNSEQPAGIAWTREMSDFVHQLDRSRLTTLASNHARDTAIKSPEGEGSNYVDLININVYGEMGYVAEQIERVHSHWPDRVILISEFASLDRGTFGDEERARYVRSFMEVIRAHPYVAGVSLWTFNDYRSRWPATMADGYRHFGAVTETRERTAMYWALRDEFSPVTIRGAKPASGRDGSYQVTVAARADFPAYAIRDYTARCSWLDGAQVLGTSSATIPLLQPGAEATVSCKSARSGAWGTFLRVEIVRPTGYTVTERTTPVH